MIVTKIIKGKIIGYESCKENYMKCDAMEGRDECDYISDSYDLYYRDRTYYFIIYSNMRVQYSVKGLEKEVVFKEVYSERFFEKDDIIRLSYNKISKRVFPTDR